MFLSIDTYQVSYTAYKFYERRIPKRDQRDKSKIHMLVTFELLTMGEKFAY